jgi:nucleotide-binding universal stress UspA family protein
MPNKSLFMKKILLSFDGTNFSEGAFEFARRLNKFDPILLIGVFLPQTQLANLWSYADNSSPSDIPMVENEESELVQKNIERFEQLCIANNIKYHVHKEFYDFVLPQLTRESCFADLLILGTEKFYESMSAGIPNKFLSDALHDVKCPVLLVPEKFEFPEQIILTYDGSTESVFAIKQFSYLFPELCRRQTLLVYVTYNGEKNFPQKMQIEELVTIHFSNLSIDKLELNTNKLFSTWLLQKKAALIVCGSYGRSGMSQLFRKSFIENTIADNRIPVFIAHK